MKKTHLVYDFADQFPLTIIMLIPLLFVGIGIGIFFYCKKKVDINSSSNTRRKGMVAGVFMAFMGSLFFLFTSYMMLKEYIYTRKIYNNDLYNSISGKVENYHPMPEGGHDTERFDVNGISFQFSDFDKSDYGYNNAASHGGAIREGLYVRIAYFNNGNKNVILKLETE